MSEVKVERIEYARRVRFTYQMLRCEATVGDATARWRARAGKDDICERSAAYRVNGRHLCKLHAGDACLELLTAEEAYVVTPLGGRPLPSGGGL